MICIKPDAEATSVGLLLWQAPSLLLAPLSHLSHRPETIKNSAENSDRDKPWEAWHTEVNLHEPVATDGNPQPYRDPRVQVLEPHPWGGQYAKALERLSLSVKPDHGAVLWTPHTITTTTPGILPVSVLEAVAIDLDLR
ncbi:hypothetical protein CMEL01_11302 [Colletotrichum melonis]|uniref:Uncharacterized protein n=1 Tax=Colletotrichum melonis TaxID=1209925 RepID=A0AAI9UYR0_9PEZI|nr:hypothetical protein CMEL01_11302 [Colletotrichum melonis]